MKIRTLFFSLTLVWILTSCSTYVYYNSTNENPNIDWSDATILDLSKFECYYRVIYRNNADLSTIVNEAPGADTNENIHITDLQYIFINRSTNRFIVFSYMPVHNRLFEFKAPQARDTLKGKYHDEKERYKPATNYLDRLKGLYKSEIWLNGIRQIQYGEIVNNELYFEFEPCRKNNKKKNRKNRYLLYEKSGNNEIQLKQIRYPDNKFTIDDTISFTGLFEKEYHTYRKIDTPDTPKLYMKTGNKHDQKLLLKNEIIISKHTGKGSVKNLIIFTYVHERKNAARQNVYPILFFMQKGDRFKFVNPDRD